jgi:hypothetical protein
MGYIEGHSRDQVLLLPASVDDYVAADNPENTCNAPAPKLSQNACFDTDRSPFAFRLTNSTWLL